MKRSRKSVLLCNIGFTVALSTSATAARAEVHIWSDKYQDQAYWFMVGQSEKLAFEKILNKIGPGSPADRFTKVTSCTSSGWYASANTAASMIIAERQRYDVINGGSCGKPSREAAILAAVESCISKGGCNQILDDVTYSKWISLSWGLDNDGTPVQLDGAGVTVERYGPGKNQVDRRVRYRVQCSFKTNAIDFDGPQPCMKALGIKP